MHVNDHSVHPPVPLDSRNTEDAAAAAAATLPRSFRRSTQTTTMGVTKDTVKPGDGPVLVTGVSGGVGTVAGLLLQHLGYEVVGLTGSIDAMGEPVSESAAKHFERLQLGSTHLIHRESMSRAGKPLQKEQFAAVVDSVTLETADGSP